MDDMLHEILRAARRLRRALRPTPLEESIRLGALTDGRALLKLENTQPTGVVQSARRAERIAGTVASRS